MLETIHFDRNDFRPMDDQLPWLPIDDTVYSDVMWPEMNEIIHVMQRDFDLLTLLKAFFFFFFLSIL